MLKTLRSSPSYTHSKRLLYRSYRYYSNSTNRRGTHLEGLNESQRRAVLFPPDTSLQILAGPGTGKTRVLTSRIAEFVLDHSFPPSSICAVTFTKKASREMKSRLTGYIGRKPTDELKLGTFHSLCARYLRLYGAIVGVSPKFAIWDEDECELLINFIAGKYHPNLVGRADRIAELVATIKERQTVDPASSLEEILKEQRNKGDEGREAYNKNDPLYDPNMIQRILDEYFFVLSKSEALDFTDLLIKGLDVIQAVPWAREVKELRHVLVDEFQDTSSIQYLIVRQLSKAARNHVSVVGDPDQSIYGWRGADLPQTTSIYLEENYRSTASVIAAAVNIISQDTTRPPKTLFTSHSPDGPKAILRGFPDMQDESDFIASEINRIVEKSEGFLGYGKCAILFRNNHSPWEFVGALKKHGVPFRWLPEKTLNDRIEVRGLIAFLRLALDPTHTPMLISALMGPLELNKKIIGDLMEKSIEHKLTMYDIVTQVYQQGDPRAVHPGGKQKSKKPSVYEVATKLVELLARLRELLSEGVTPADLLHEILRSTDYTAYLQRIYGEDGLKWPERNIRKLMDYAGNFKASVNSDSRSSLYAFFDFMSSLSRPPDEDTGVVTLLTSHSAKGLEWPVVFVPEVVDGVYPHVHADDPDEERRLLYVACTRAQCLLYITFSGIKMTGRKDDKSPLTLYVSDFIKDMSPELHDDQPPDLNQEHLLLFQRLLGKKQTAELLFKGYVD